MSKNKIIVNCPMLQLNPFTKNESVIEFNNNANLYLYKRQLYKLINNSSTIGGQHMQVLLFMNAFKLTLEIRLINYQIITLFLETDKITTHNCSLN